MEFFTFIPFLHDFEQQLCRELHISSPKDLQGPIIAIGGFSGVGKDTLGVSIRERLKSLGINLKVYGSGQYIREYSRRMGYPDAHLDDFLQAIRNDENFAQEVDHFVDKQTLSEALGRGQGIFIGRMAPFVIGSWGLTIWVSVDPSTRASRLVTDPKRPEYGLSKEEVFERIERRDNNDIARLERIYSINFHDLIKKIDCQLENTHNTIQKSENIAFDSIISKYNYNFR